MNSLLKMFFYLFIVFLLTINEIHSEIRKSETKILKLIADKICVANPEKNFADKITNCENFMKPTVFQLNS